MKRTIPWAIVRSSSILIIYEKSNKLTIPEYEHGPYGEDDDEGDADNDPGPTRCERHPILDGNTYVIFVARSTLTYSYYSRDSL